MHTLIKPETLSDKGIFLQIPAGVHHFTDDEFFAFCQANRPLNFERDKSGNIFVIMPTGSKTSNTNIEIAADFVIWNRKHKLGKVFDSSGGFTLPDTSVKSADVAWIENARWNAVPEGQQEKFAPICPDFVLELRSPSDRLADAQTKMREWIENGCRLAWLLDLPNEKVYTFRQDGTQAEMQGFDHILSGENVLAGFELNLQVLKSN